MTKSVIILRAPLYLNARYQWTHIPHLFPTWQAGDVLGLMLGCSDKPTGYAVVSGGVVDLDTLEVVRI